VIIENKDNQQKFQPDNSFVTFCAVRYALFSTKCANPLRGPELQVKLMFDGHLRCKGIYMTKNYVVLIQNAKLNEQLKFVYSNAKDNINKLQEYYSVIHGVELKDIEQKNFFYNSIIQNIETIISAYITDMLKEFSLTDWNSQYPYSA
jgi:hypothetical protein